LILKAETFTGKKEKHFLPKITDTHIFSPNNCLHPNQPSPNIDSSFLTIELFSSLVKMFRQTTDLCAKEGQSNSDFLVLVMAVQIHIQIAERKRDMSRLLCVKCERNKNSEIRNRILENWIENIKKVNQNHVPND
jgi:hypothetical protein